MARVLVTPDLQKIIMSGVDSLKHEAAVLSRAEMEFPRPLNPRH